MNLNRKTILALLLLSSIVFYGQSIKTSKSLIDEIEKGETTVVFEGFGTEPFWHIYITKNEILKTENEYKEVFKLKNKFDPNLNSQNISYVDRNGKQFSIEIIKKPSGDGMSDRIYPYSCNDGAGTTEFDSGRFKYFAMTEDADYQYKQGLKMVKDRRYNDAIYYFKKSADQGNTKAEFQLGSILVHGFGDEYNPGLGMTMLKNLANEGDEDAQNLLKELAKDGIK